MFSNIIKLNPKKNNLNNNWLPKTVRVHSSLLRYSWSKLYYCLRDIDSKGSGYVNVSFSWLTKRLKTYSSTLYEHLRLAREAGAIYSYKRYRDKIVIHIGGLINICKTLGLKTWGITARVEFSEVLENSRELATALNTQDLQERSRYAAKKSLSEEKLCYRLPEAWQVINKSTLSSAKLASGDRIPYLLHVGAKRAFVSKGFVPFGTNQQTIADSLSICDRTVRLHLKNLAVDSRQIVQTKSLYNKFSLTEYPANSNINNEDSSNYFELLEDKVILHETNGHSKSFKKDGFEIPLIEGKVNAGAERFFTYLGKTWFYRCSLYDVSYELSSMRYRRREYKEYLKKISNSNAKKRICAGLSI